MPAVAFVEDGGGDLLPQTAAQGVVLGISTDHMVQGLAQDSGFRVANLLDSTIEAS